MCGEVRAECMTPHEVSQYKFPGYRGPCITGAMLPPPAPFNVQNDPSPITEEDAQHTER